VQRFRGGLVFKAHRLLYHSTLGLSVLKKKKGGTVRNCRRSAGARSPASAVRGPTLSTPSSTDPSIFHSLSRTHTLSLCRSLSDKSRDKLGCRQKEGRRVRHLPTDRGRDDREIEFFIDNLLVRIHLIIVMIGWAGLASWAFESPFPGSLVWGAGCRVQGAGCRVQGAGCKVQGVGCRVLGAGCRV